MKEVVDVVDAHDNFVSKSDRDEVHKKGLLHRVVQVMLFNADGELYMQQRSASKDLHPLCWEGSLSGHVLSKESFVNAAERELHEELGVCVSPRHLKNLLKFGFRDDSEKVLVTLYAVRDFKGDIKIDPEEVKTGAFWPLKKVEAELKNGKKPVHPLFRKALEEFKALGEKTVEFVKVSRNANKAGV